MTLFPINSNENLLPCDGDVRDYGTVLTVIAANDYFHRLMTHIQWQNDQAIIHGKHITTARKVAWYGDQPYRYIYSRISRIALPWTDDLLDIKHLVEDITDEVFNSCLLNLYANGNESMGWHSDNEQAIRPNSTIASLSLGATRNFSFKHKDNQTTVTLPLQHGQLITMQGQTQQHWLHRLTTSQKVTSPRINLTFRIIKSTPS